MNVYLFTSVPLTSPWDQGDKNLAAMLAKALPHIQFQVMTARNKQAPPGSNIINRPVYWSRRPSVLQKAWVLLRLLNYAGIPGTGKKKKNCSPDLIHFIYQPKSLSSWLIKKMPTFRQRPSVHTVPAIRGTDGLSPNLFYANKIVALSEFGKGQLQKIGVRNVTHIPPGIEVERWESLSKSKEECKQRIGVHEDLTILYAGHYGADYGVWTLIKALPPILAGKPRVRLLLACRERHRDDPARKRAIKSYLTVTHSDHAVSFMDTVEDMRTLIGASDIVVFPFRTMRDKLDIPTTMLEGLAAGVPAVVSDIPPMNELFTNPATYPSQHPVGLTIPPENPDALADALRTLIEDPALRQRMGMAGQELVRGKFSIDRVAREYEKIYQEILYEA